MNILITNAALDGLAGTELVVDEIARELFRRGHRVTAFTPRPGQVSRDLAAAGIPVADTPSKIPADIDVIHGQHHLPTMIALAALPRTPAIYFVHGYAPWEEQPPSHPRIQRYLCAAPRLERWVQGALALQPDATATLPNWVDLRKFSRVGEPAATPASAVIFANHCKVEHAEILEAACRRSGVRLAKMGRAFGNPRSDPEAVLPGFDIAFAPGRSALEAMASGCAVIPFRDGRIAPMISPGSFEESAERNFTVEPDGPPMDVSTVISEMDSYNSEAASEMALKIRREFSLKTAIDALERHYGSALNSWNAVSADPESESRCLAEYLASLANHELELTVQSEERATRLNRGWEKTKQKRESLSTENGAVKKKLRLVEEHLSRGLFRRPLLQRIKSGWGEIEANSKSPPRGEGR